MTCFSEAGCLRRFRAHFVAIFRAAWKGTVRAETILPERFLRDRLSEQITREEFMQVIPFLCWHLPGK
ncbi:MAG: hypothetical protein SPI71_07680 [Acidaminococcaceae bacterium]|nr:hypothetical protein [Acidaminococcaceae bacterium]